MNKNTQQKQYVLDILSEPPVDYYDTNSMIAQQSSYELVSEREINSPEGPIKTKDIGSVNTLLAIHHLMNDVEDESNVKVTWNSILNELEEDKKIRRIPEKVRSTFTVISNEDN